VRDSRGAQAVVSFTAKNDLAVCRSVKLGGRSDLSTANQEASEAVTPVSGVYVAFASVSDHIDYIPDPTAQTAQELGKYTSTVTVDNPSFSTTPTTMSTLRSLNPCFGLSRRTGAIAVSGFIVVASSVFVVLCFSQLSGKCAVLCSCDVSFFSDRTGRGQLELGYEVVPRRDSPSRA